MTDADLPTASRTVADALAERGIAAEIRRFPEGTRTAADAARAIGCPVAAIAKSLVFRAEPGSRPVLAIASGANRVDEAALAQALAPALGAVTIARADAGYVRAITGFAIGGVPPVGHAQPMTVAIDRDLTTLATIWAAAGTPDTVFALTPDDLVRLTGGQVADLKDGTRPDHG